MENSRGAWFQLTDPTTGQHPNSLRFIDPANLLTLIALAAAVVCAVLAMKGLLAYAVVALMVAGLCDLFDGFVARRLKRSDDQREFGGHLDSVVDACSFGFAPVVLMYCAGLASVLETVLLVLFAVCAIWRLAYFETVGLQDGGARRYYSGLPTTYVAVVLPLAFVPGFFNAEWIRVSIVITACGLAVAMVSSVRIPKPGGLSYLVFLVLGVGLSGALIVFAPQLHQ